MPYVLMNLKSPIFAFLGSRLRRIAWIFWLYCLKWVKCHLFSIKELILQNKSWIWLKLQIWQYNDHLQISNCLKTSSTSKLSPKMLQKIVSFHLSHISCNIINFHCKFHCPFLKEWPRPMHLFTYEQLL